MDSGIGGLPAGAIGNEGAFAGGGIVAFAAGDPVESAERDPVDVAFDRLIRTESGGVHIDPKTRKMLTNTQSGAMGVAQFMPGTLKDPGFGVVPPRDNSREEHLRAGKDYFKAMVKESKGNIAEGAARYNWGTGNVDNAKAQAQVKAKANPDKIFNWMDTAPNETKKYVALVAPQNTRVTEPVAPQNAAPDTDQQTNPYAVGAGAMAAAGAAALPPVKTGIASVPNDPAVFRSNRVPPAGVPPAGVPPASVPPAGTPSWLSQGLGALRKIAASPYTTGAGLMLHSSEAGRGSDIVPNKPAGRPPTPREIDELYVSGKISDVEAREMLKRLPVVPAVPVAKSPVDDVSQADRNQGSTDRGPDGTKYSPPGFVSRTPVDAETAFMNDIRNEIMTGLRDKTPPETLEAYTARHEAMDRKLGVDPGATKKFFEDQAKGFTEQATQARQDRNVNLWMSAANGFFAMAGGMSPYAMKNFADGLGVGTKQATVALNDYRNIDREIAKNQRDMSKLQLQTNMGHAEKYAAREDKFLERQTALEAKKQATLMTLYGHLGTQANTKATQANTSMLREISMAETARSNEAREEAKREDQRRQNLVAWGKYQESEEYRKLLNNVKKAGNDPKNLALANRALIDKKAEYLGSGGGQSAGASSNSTWGKPEIIKP
jgi:hypothetical protein